MSGPPKSAQPGKAIRPRKDAPRPAVSPSSDPSLAIAALNAELDRLREAQGVLIAELSIRDNEAQFVRETLTKQDGDVARVRRGWQQATDVASETRRKLADADVAADALRAEAARHAEALRQEISEREGRIELLTAEISAMRATILSAEDSLAALRAQTGGQQAEIEQLNQAVARSTQTIEELHAKLAAREAEAAAEIRDLRDRLAARSDDLSVLSVQTASRIAELAAAGMAQGDTIARLTGDLGSVRTELMREAASHSEARRAIEAGEAVLARLTVQLNEARGLAQTHAEDATALREQMWSLERDLSASRQRGAEQDDRLAALNAELSAVREARDAAVAEQARLASRVEADTQVLQLMRADIEGAKAMMRQIALVPDSGAVVAATVGAGQPVERPNHEAALARAGLDGELSALRLDLAARDELRRKRERALDAARRQALAAEASATEARLNLIERDRMVAGLADQLTIRDSEQSALESRIVSLVREGDRRETEQGKLDRRLQSIARSSSYRLGLFAAGIMRGWRRAVRRLRRGKANPLFDFAWYLENNPDVRWLGVDPYSHYLNFGRAEGRTPNRIFQPQWYLDVNPDVKASGIEPLQHYLGYGAAEGRNPAPGFDLHAYLERHPEAGKRGRHPLLHFLKNAAPGEALPSGGPRILVVAWHCPTRAHAGGLRMLDLYEYLRRAAPNVRLDLFTVKKPAVDWAYDDLKSIFDNVYFTDHDDLSLKALNALRVDRMVYDVVDFQFLEAGHDLESYRAVGRKLIFTPMELLSRAFHIERQSPGRIATSQRLSEQMDVSRRELALCQSVDEVVCVSRPDADYLRAVTGLNSVTALETGVSELEFGGVEPAGDASRKSKKIVFVAYFGSPTNVEALDWYLNEVHPRIKAAVPDYQIDVVGRGDLSKYKSLDDPCVNLVGEVPSVGPYIARAAAGISPALSGAGFRGKINQYAILGLATVASPIAAEGFAYRHGEDILVGPDAESFAAHCVALLQDSDLNARLAANALRTCQQTYSWSSRDAVIRAIYGVKRPRQAGAPVITAVVPSYNHGRYIEQRIRSILDQTYPNIDLIVIDDKSPDDSDQVIRRLRDQFGFTYIRRDQNSGTPFSAWAYAAEKAAGDFIWICESDDVALPDFAATGVDRLCRDRDAALYYCNSHVIDTEGAIIGSTASYFRDIWQDPRWEASFTADGRKELSDYQVRGMIVPNMSSALIRTGAFRAAFKPDLLKFGLTGDWLFVGRVLTQGNAIFDVQSLSCFRQHAQTARERVKSARSQAEFIITKYRLHKLARKRPRDLAVTLKADATRFIYEPASARQVLGGMWRISKLDTIRAGATLCWSMLFHRAYWGKFRARLKDRRSMPGSV